MSETSEDRKARLAALRKKKKEPSSISPVHNDLIDSQKMNESKATKKEEINEGDSMINEENTEIQTPPILRISENETVEVVAARIQEEVFESIRNKNAQHGLAEKQRISKKSKHSYNSDLKKDIESMLRRAQIKTDQALTNILRRKFQKQLT